jgi:iron complex outermembrane receptor protein
MHFSNASATVSPRTTLPAYSVVNMRLTWSGIEGTRLSASVYVRNLFNKAYFTGGNPAAAGGSTNVVDPGMPRIVGGELRFAF